ncbi:MULTISPECIES: hypothetical protein [Streptomyces]|uniref:hypothetical protein n=1 Tax=Streptomyces TaxID=1883 RepID=UPI000241B89A|nr:MULTISPECIES: hypothetical protein [Streptomyces]EHM26562.1 hypothetical protein SPW_5033 [Streptomyces sp. W007]MCX4486803.1 hypothetical protein [Streptomyces anulatus]MCX4523086.1 hypothetical protein [Streptomyces anulatus]MCX4606097.1 hypothetical protein [Streptomyces anulatus]WSI82082.1 hypothetical protein OG557_36390 [Streptomyces anulatus]
MDTHEDLGPGSGHPWFGGHRLRPAASADTIRQMLRHELRDTGWPHQRVLPAAPMAIPRAAYAEIFRASVALVDLLRRAALESGHTTADRLAAYEMPAAEDRLWVSDPFIEERYADSVVRPDLVIGPDGPQFLEFNVSGALGGVVETQSRLAVWRGLHADEEGRTPFRSPSPFAVRAEMFRSLSAELAVAPRVAVVGSARVTGVERRYFEMEADYYNSHGLTARFFEPEELPEAWDCAPHLRYPVGLRNFTIPDWLDAGLDTTPVQGALDHGCLLVGTQTSTFLHSKLTMGLLSEGRPWMTEGDRGLVQRYLPWTRILSERRTEREGQQVDLLPFVLKNRELLVLKAALGESGQQVTIGREADQAAWESAVGEAVQGRTSVVQEFVRPGTCRVALIADGVDEPYDVDVAPVLGPLLFGGRPAGLFCRFFGDGSAGIVSVRGGTSSSDNVMVAI